MHLRFPNARLHVHDLLSSTKQSGGEAIVMAACDYGLIPHTSAYEIATHAKPTSCQCMKCCEGVIDAYLRDRHAKDKLKDVTAGELISNIQYEAQEYERSKKHKAEVNGHDCTMFAPALFDLMLQQIHKYE